MALVIKTSAVGADDKHVVEIVVYQAVQKVGLSGWTHLSESHRAGLIAQEGLLLVLAQATDSAETLKRVTRLITQTCTVASQSEITVDHRGRHVITVDLDQV